MPEGVGYSGSNVVAGAGLELNIVGEFAYAYSGLIAQGSPAVTNLDFTTGNYILVGEIQLNASVDDDDPSTGGSSTCMIKFNGVSISLIKADGELERAPASQTQAVIIPPYTSVNCAVDTGGSGASDQFTSVSFTGKVYK